MTFIMVKPSAMPSSPLRLSPVRPFARWVWPVVTALAAGLVQAQSTAPVPPRHEPLPGDYRVVDGRVDRGTYSGWRLFQTNCQRCHGVGGVGTSAAPNLLERIPNLTPKAFASKVLTSYRVVRMTPDNGGADRETERERLLEEVMRRERTARGEPVMPAWDADEGVSPHVLDLYAYLTARAEGAIGPGRPAVIVDKKR